MNLFKISPRIFLTMPMIILFVFLFVIPLSKLFWISLNENYSFSAYSYIFSQKVFGKVFLNTIIISIEASLITVVVCIPVSYFLIQISRKKAALFIGFLTLPFWMSVLVRSFSWIVLLQHEGVVIKLLNLTGFSSASLLYTRGSVLAGMVYIFVPYVILILYTSFNKVDKNLWFTGFSLGANKTEVFLKVFLPQVVSSIFLSAIYVFIISLGYFITPALLGGAKETTISMLIDIDMNQTLNWAQGAAISFLILGLILPIVFIGAILFNRKRFISHD